MARKNWKEIKAIREAREKLENDKVRNTIRWAFEIVVALLFGALTAVLMFQSVTMQESSMEPTISVGDRFYMNRVVYRVLDPERGDIIVFKNNGSDSAALHIRRIVGLPGETVQIVDGRVLINGATLKETGNYPSMISAGQAERPLTLGSGEYFVLGDNRNNSEDSRYGDIGLVNKRYIVGKLWFKLFPTEDLGLIRY